MGRWPPDDLRWCSLGAAIQLRASQTRDLTSAVRDLAQRMVSGELRSQRRYTVKQSGTVTLVNEELEPTFWKAHDIDAHRSWHVLSVIIFRRNMWKPGEYQAADCVEGAFSVWMPDFDRHSGDERADADDDTPPRVKPGRKSRGDWPTRITQWLIEVALYDPQKLQPPQNIDELVIEAKIFLRNQMKWAPKDDKDLRAHIVVLLKRVRR